MVDVYEKENKLFIFPLGIFSILMGQYIWIISFKIDSKSTLR